METKHKSDLQSKEAERQQHQRALEQEYQRGKEAGCARFLFVLQGLRLRVPG